MSSICVIGGTRYFGKIAVRTLVAQGHAVTLMTRGRSGDDFGETVQRLKADANNVDEMRTALSGKSFDVVIHQMCYSPIAARAASLAFEGRTGRLIMTSTLEVYNPATFEAQPASSISAMARESELDTAAYRVDDNLPWHDPVFIDSHYAEGKRQAEGALAQTASFPVTVVRVGHVLSDRDEFTGRLQFHVDRILQGQTIKSWPRPGKTSFIYAEDIARFMVWACTARFTGAINACSPDALSVYDLCAAIEAAADRTARIEETPDPRGDEALSPFSYPYDFGMSTDRASELGYRFLSTADWLPRIAQSAVAQARS